MDISASAALWFAPFVVPVCLYVCWTDVATMKIRNHAVVALFIIYAVVGLIALPFDTYLWRYVHLLVVLAFGIAMTAGGVMGAGDAKFLAVAAPFIHIGDLRFLIFLLAACVLAALVAHRLVRASPLRKLAPDWESWNSGQRFPMGLALGPWLGLYLLAGVFLGRAA